MNGQPIPRHQVVAHPKPVRFLLVPDRVTTVTELATLLGLMGCGVVGHDGWEALRANGVDHLFEREQGSAIIAPLPNVSGVPQA